MSEQDNVEVMKQAYAAFNSGDISKVLGTFADDIVFQWPPVQGVGWTKTRRGKEELARFFEELAAAEDVEEAAPQQFIAQGDKVVVPFLFRSTVKATGRPNNNSMLQIFTLRDGKIREVESFLDTAALADAHRK